MSFKNQSGVKPLPLSRCGKFLLASLLLATVLPAGGCDGGRGSRVSVGGKVEIDGEPLKFGTITFLPIKEGDSPTRAGSGEFDEEGRFQASSYTPGDGLLKGKYQVFITATEPMGETGQRWHAPKKYAGAGTSGLTTEILTATEDLDFDLTWDGEKNRKPFVEKFD